MKHGTDTFTLDFIPNPTLPYQKNGWYTRGYLNTHDPQRWIMASSPVLQLQVITRKLLTIWRHIHGMCLNKTIGTCVLCKIHASRLSLRCTKQAKRCFSIINVISRVCVLQLESAWPASYTWMYRTQCSETMTGERASGICAVFSRARRTRTRLQTDLSHGNILLRQTTRWLCTLCCVCDTAVESENSFLHFDMNMPAEEGKFKL